MTTAKEVFTHPSFMTLLTIFVIINFVLIMVYVVGGMQSDLTTREFPAIKYEANIIRVSNTNKTLAHGESGSVVLFSTTTGVSVTLPKPKLGVFYNIQVEDDTATAGGGIYISTASTEEMVGVISVGDTDPAGSGVSVFAADTGQDEINLDGSGSGGERGTNIEILSDGTSWIVSGFTATAGTAISPFV